MVNGSPLDSLSGQAEGAWEMLGERHKSSRIDVTTRLPPFNPVASGRG
jgi:hypothetical protein